MVYLVKRLGYIHVDYIGTMSIIKDFRQYIYKNNKI